MIFKYSFNEKIKGNSGGTAQNKRESKFGPFKTSRR